ncbi:MAG: Lrp/AsnC family transcriptional regulator [Thermoplasmatales archaeon]|nr:MAG: Lrp/AsnC family transcriptional regulator [Thermoplasmatales archaeon]
MPKSSKKQMYADEMKIVEELQKNSKESIDAIAKRCGFSRQKVWRNIKRLEKNKTIWGYHAVVDDEKLGLRRYFILIKRTNKPATKEKIDYVITRKLSKETAEIGVNVECSYYVHGSFDWLICITASHLRQVKKFCEAFNVLFEEGYVANIQVLEVIFPVEKNGMNNPDIDKIKEFFPI